MTPARFQTKSLCGDTEASGPPCLGPRRGLVHFVQLCTCGCTQFTWGASAVRGAWGLASPSITPAGSTRAAASRTGRASVRPAGPRLGAHTVSVLSPGPGHAGRARLHPRGVHLHFLQRGLPERRPFPLKWSFHLVEKQPTAPMRVISCPSFCPVGGSVCSLCQHHTLDDCSFVASFEIRKCESSLFFFKIICLFRSL